MDPPRLDGKDDTVWREEPMGYLFREASELARSEKDFVCVDGSPGADKAFRWALKNLPKDHRLVMVHGIYAPLTGWTAEDLMLDHMRVQERYAPVCLAEGRQCSFFSFPYLTMGAFGDTVCKFARYNGVNSVVTGRRSEVTGLRRHILGSGSMAVLNHCEVPVSVVSDATPEDKITRRQER
jgi:nucleotide-binding universal stress UspA family protein